jgi:hypothetical protein
MRLMRLRRGDALPAHAEERWLAEGIGRARQQRAEASGTTEQRRSTHDPLAMNIGGALCELLIAKQFNVYPDFSLRRGDRGYDCRLHDGRTVDVKWNPTGTDLIVLPHKQTAGADLYMLVCGERPLTFGGWTTAMFVFRPEHLLDLGFGLNYVVREYALYRQWEGRTS